MTRTPLFWFVLYVHTAFGLVSIVAPLIAWSSAPGGDRHRRAGWWFVQSVAGLFATTAVLASIRYSFFLFVIGYVAWYGAHQAWLTVARPGERTYLASPLACRVQHDLAMVLGALLAAASVATLVRPDWPFTPGGLGLGVAFVYGSVLAIFGWAGRGGVLAPLATGQRHLLYVGLAATATYSEFFADVTNLFMRATGVWISSWILPAAAAGIVVVRRVGVQDVRNRIAALLETGVTARAVGR